MARDGAHVEAGVDTDGVTAEVAYTWRNGWGVWSYLQKTWVGETTAGVRVKKKW